MSMAKSKSEILEVRPAGDDHQVVTVQRDAERKTGHLYRRKPCAKCPWRVDAVGDVPRRGLRSTRPVPPTICLIVSLAAMTPAPASRPPAPGSCCAARTTTCGYAWPTSRGRYRAIWKKVALNCSRAIVKWPSLTALILMIQCWRSVETDTCQGRA